MFASRRAFVVARRQIPLTYNRSIVPAFRSYSVDADVDVTLQNPSEDVTEVNQEDVITKPKYARTTAARPATATKPSPVRASTAAKPTASPAATRTATTTSFPPKSASKLANFHTPVSPSKSTLSESSETDVESTHDINWETSWFGLGVKPVTVEQSEVLSRPIDVEDVEVKPDGIVYLPEVKYRRRLNEAFGPMGWGMVHRGEVVVGQNIVTREYALIVNGRYVEHYLHNLSTAAVTNVR
jgi:hypothetical protein